jgi:predicted transcriptional regulator
MKKVTVCTGDAHGFFARAKDAARRADQGKPFDGRVTLSFEDPQRMFAVLSEARRKLMLEVMHEPQTISQLSSRLRRNRSTITRDVGLLEKLGLVVSNREANPGHGIQKVVRAVAPKVELVATLG